MSRAPSNRHPAVDLRPQGRTTIKLSAVNTRRFVVDAFLTGFATMSRSVACCRTVKDTQPQPFSTVTRLALAAASRLMALNPAAVGAAGSNCAAPAREDRGRSGLAATDMADAAQRRSAATNRRWPRVRRSRRHWAEPMDRQQQSSRLASLSDALGRAADRRAIRSHCSCGRQRASSLIYPLQIPTSLAVAQQQRPVFRQHLGTGSATTSLAVRGPVIPPPLIDRPWPGPPAQPVVPVAGGQPRRVRGKQAPAGHPYRIALPVKQVHRIIE